MKKRLGFTLLMAALLACSREEPAKPQTSSTPNHDRKKPASEVPPVNEPPVRRDTNEEIGEDGATWLAKHQNSDGSWGEAQAVDVGGATFDLEAQTAAALAALLAQDPKLEVRIGSEGKPVADFIKSGLQWLGSRAPSSAVANVLATQALLENASGSLDEESKAQTAFKHLVSLQESNGAWGGGELVSSLAARPVNMAVTLKFPGSKEAAEKLAAYLKPLVATNPRALFGYLLAGGDDETAKEQMAQYAVTRVPPGEWAAVFEWTLATFAIYAVDTRAGDRWRSWHTNIGQLLGRRELDTVSGSLGQKVVRVSFLSMTHGLYLRCHPAIRTPEDPR